MSARIIPLHRLSESESPNDTKLAAAGHFIGDERHRRADERTMPSVSLYQGADYKPSWLHVPCTTWLERLAGHYGPVGERLAARHGAKA